jgi:hypothetical protein
MKYSDTIPLWDHARSQLQRVDHFAMTSAKVFALLQTDRIDKAFLVDAYNACEIEGIRPEFRYTFSEDDWEVVFIKR